MQPFAQGLLAPELAREHGLEGRTVAAGDDHAPELVDVGLGPGEQHVHERPRLGVERAAAVPLVVVGRDLRDREQLGKRQQVVRIEPVHVRRQGRAGARSAAVDHERAEVLGEPLVQPQRSFRVRDVEQAVDVLVLGHARRAAPIVHVVHEQQPTAVGPGVVEAGDVVLEPAPGRRVGARERRVAEHDHLHRRGVDDERRQQHGERLAQVFEAERHAERDSARGVGDHLDVRRAHRGPRVRRHRGGGTRLGGRREPRREQRRGQRPGREAAQPRLSSPARSRLCAAPWRPSTHRSWDRARWPRSRHRRRRARSSARGRGA